MVKGRGDNLWEAHTHVCKKSGVLKLRDALGKPNWLRSSVCASASWRTKIETAQNTETRAPLLCSNPAPNRVVAGAGVTNMVLGINLHLWSSCGLEREREGVKVILKHTKEARHAYAVFDAGVE